MEDTPEVRHFEYRTPRHPFSATLDVEVAQGERCRVIKVQGIDISVDGIAVEADHQFGPEEPVILMVPLWEHSVVRITGRLLYQSEDQCRFAFEFCSADQCVQIQELVTQLSRHR